MPTENGVAFKHSYHLTPPAQSFTFRGQTFSITVREQYVTVRDPCWTDGRKKFSRGYTQLREPPFTEHDESAEHMLQRISDDAARTEDQRAKLQGALVSTGYTTPNASPASQRSMRSHSEKGKPSPESSAGMTKPPSTKRAALGSKATLSARLQSEPHAVAPMGPPSPRPSAWASGSSSIGRRQQAASAAGSSDPSSSTARQSATAMELEDFPLLQPAASSGSRTPSKPSRPPNIMGAASSAASALVYSSPNTDLQPRAEPAVTRAARAEGRGDITERIPTMEERLEALAPRGRIQRKQWLSEEQKHELKMALQRERRAQDKRLKQATTHR